MSTSESRNIKYFNISANDEAWGLVVTTIGYQPVPAHSSYPRSQHPQSHIFDPAKGRVLDEYQLIYISEGCGWFCSESCTRRKVKAGTIILLFPGEWHSYEPDPESGWFEYWVGFRGLEMDRRVNAGFFSPRNPLFDIGFCPSVISLYEDIADYASDEKIAYQQMMAGIVLYMLGSVYFRHRNASFADSFAVNKINEARALMKQEGGYLLSPESIAERLGVSYSWFRKMFKRYVDVSPAQYQSNIRLLKAKELLDSAECGITDIAYRLGFETVSQFSTFFRKKTGSSPLQYKKFTRK